MSYGAEVPLIAEVGCEGSNHSISDIYRNSPITTPRVVILEPSTLWSVFNDGPNAYYREKIEKLGIPVLTANIYANPEIWKDLNINVLFLENVLNDPTSHPDFVNLAANLRKCIVVNGMVFVIHTIFKKGANYQKFISLLEPEFEIVFDDLTADRPHLAEESVEFSMRKLAKVITSMPPNTADHPLINRLEIESEDPQSRWLVFKKKPLPAEDLL